MLGITKDEITNALKFGLLFGVVRFIAIAIVFTVVLLAIATLLIAIFPPLAVLGVGAIVAGIAGGAPLIIGGAALFGMIGLTAFGAIVGSNPIVDAIVYGIAIYGILGTLILALLNRLKLETDNNLMRLGFIAAIPHVLRFFNRGAGVIDTTMAFLFILFDLIVVWVCVKIFERWEVELPS